MIHKSKQVLVFSLLVLFLLGGRALAGGTVKKDALNSTVTSPSMVGMPFDWDIYEAVTVMDATIVMDGNVTVHPGGSLTLEHVTLKMNVLEDGQYHIEVQGGGAMYIRNGSIITDGDLDDDNLPYDSTSNARFNFTVDSGAVFEMWDSELHECGFLSDTWSNRGLYIEADNPVIVNNLISHNYQGLFLYSITQGILIDNTVDSNSRGLCLHTSKHNTLIGNSISYNYGTGLMVDASDCNIIDFCVVTGNSEASHECGSFYLWEADSNVITNCTINESKRRGLLMIGKCQYNTIKSCAMGGNVWEGIYLADSSWHNVIEDCVIQGNGVCGIGICSHPLKFDICVASARDNTVKNCLIKDNATSGITIGLLADSNSIEGNRIINNQCGILIDSASTGNIIEDNLIANNATYGVHVFDVLENVVPPGAFSLVINYNAIVGNAAYGILNIDNAVIVDARYNWWGDPNGPGDVGPGTGDDVSEWVDYEPWLEEPLGLGVKEQRLDTKVGIRLEQNFPNPFGAQTSIRYALPKESFVTLSIYNASGQKVRTLVNETKQAGEHTVHWNSLDEAGNEVATGVYFCKLQVGDYTETRKMILLK